MNGLRKLPWLALLLASLALALGARRLRRRRRRQRTEAAARRPPRRPTGGDGEAMKVGLVTDIGGLNDRGFNQLAFQGLKQAETDLGVEIRVLESKSDADYIPNLQTLADDGFDLIISVGFLMTEATAEAARRTRTRSSRSSTRPSTRPSRTRRGCSSRSRRPATSSATWPGSSPRPARSRASAARRSRRSTASSRASRRARRTRTRTSRP